MNAETTILETLSMHRPCDGCSHYFECANQKMACMDFFHYVTSGEVRNFNREPSHRYFRMVFKRTD